LEGLLVTGLGQFGRRVGIRRGDVLLAINGQRIDTARDAGRLLTDPGRRVEMDVLRQGQRVRLRFRT